MSKIKSIIANGRYFKTMKEVRDYARDNGYEITGEKDRGKIKYVRMVFMGDLLFLK